MSILQRTEAKLSLLKDAEQLLSQLRQVETERTTLIDQRASLCRQLRDAGASVSELQDVFEISRSRVQQILRTSAPNP